MDGTPHSTGRHLLALLYVGLLLPGCATCNLPEIDPTGQRFFVPRESQVVAGNPALPNLVIKQPTVAIAPRQLIAPVGSEVIMLSGVCNTDNNYNTGEKIEWMLSPDSVGEFGTVGEGGLFPWCTIFGRSSEKITNSYATSKAVTSPVHLTRGTVSPADDVTVNAGQAWITVTSPTEGTSVVTALAPNVTGWNNRKATGTIHWVDAQWVFPPAAVNPQGRNHVFTTSINRHTNGAPLVGWRVRYEILDGPAAGFAPDGREMVEVPTDDLGQASAEIVPKALESGTCRVNVQIIRPAQTNGASVTPELILGSAITTMTWTSPQLSLETTGPAQASIGSSVTYRILVNNTGDLPSAGVVVSEEIPAGVSFVSSSPEATVQGRNLQWNLGEIPAHQTQPIDVTFRMDQAGSFNHCATVRTADNLSASDCVATSVTTPQLEVSVKAQSQVEIGQEVQFEIIVTNRSAVPATGLEITSTFDPGLKHPIAESPIARQLNDLPAGSAQTIYMTFQVVSAGRACNQVVVEGAGGIRGSASACVTAVPKAPVTQAPPGNTQPPQTQPEGQPALEMSTSAPKQAKVGGEVLMSIDVNNRGDVPLTNVRISSTFDAPLRLKEAEPGFDPQRFEDELVWNIPQINAGQTRRFRIKCTCVSDAVRACLRASVTSDQTGPRADMSCLEILPTAGAGAGAAAAPLVNPPRSSPPLTTGVDPAPVAQPALPPARTNAPTVEQTPPARPADIKMTITDLADSIPLNGETTYRIVVQNDGEQSAMNVELMVNLPAELVALDTVANVSVRSYPVNGGVRFDPIAELRPGRSASYTVKCRGVRAGMARVTATVTSDGQAKAVQATESTEILSR